MKLDKHIGICHICGQRDRLTYEHVPPKSAFNNQPARLYNMLDSIGSDNLPWETPTQKAEILQKGIGKYSLCSHCNNSTGGWYGEEYVKFVRSMHYTIVGLKLTADQVLGIQATEIYPLKIFKQILAMFCSINIEGFSENSNFRDYIMDRERNDFDTGKYRLSMYICTADSMPKQIPICAVGNLRGQTFRCITELVHYPFGFVLEMDYDAEKTSPGADITAFSQCKFEDKCNVEMWIPVKSSYSYFPLDYRSKNEIIACRIKNLKYEGKE